MTLTPETAKTFHPIVLIVLHKDRKFLLTKRQIEPDDSPEFDGMWQIPGGGVGWGEDLLASAIREAKEEIGVDVVVERTLAVTQKVDPAYGWHGIFFAFLCKQVDPTAEIKINHEASDYGWYSIEQIRELNVIPSTDDILKYVNLYYRLYRVGVVSLIQNENDELLLTKTFSPKSESHDKWGFVAGWTEPSETLVSTAIREIREEVGLHATNFTMIPYVKESKNQKIFCFTTTIDMKKQIVTLNHEATEYKWISPKNLKHMEEKDLVEGTKVAVKELLKVIS